MVAMDVISDTLGIVASSADTDGRFFYKVKAINHHERVI